MQNAARHASWQELLESPQHSAHIVQIYEDDDFLACAVAVFAAEGLRRGEAVLLTGTPAHLRRVRQEVSARGVNTESATQSGQLRLFDVHEAIAQVLLDGRVDPARFEAAAAAPLAAAKADPRFSGVRWWGEITNVLTQHGNETAGLACERLGNAATEKHGVTIFCSLQHDTLHPTAYEGTLREICACHSHVIPAQDYVRHRLAVNRAVSEVVGEIRGALLQSLVSWRGLSCDLPSSQALLFWLHEAMPERLPELLARAKAYQHGETVVS